MHPHVSDSSSPHTTVILLRTSHLEIKDLFLQAHTEICLEVGCIAKWAMYLLVILWSDVVDTSKAKVKPSTASRQVRLFQNVKTDATLKYFRWFLHKIPVDISYQFSVTQRMGGWHRVSTGLKQPCRWYVPYLLEGGSWNT